MARLLTRKRPTFAFSTWFAIPEEKMVDLEILNRASAIIVPAKSPKFHSKYHIITCSHVAAPWKWPKYYPEEWLSAVNETHTHYTVEIRQDNGIFLTQTELIPNVYHHSTRDLAVLHLENEQTNIESLFNIGLTPMKLFPRELPELDSGYAVEFSGHELIGGNLMDRNDTDSRIPVPRLISGRVELSTPFQSFCRSRSVLAEGMCGGPIIVDATSVKDNVHDLVYGLVEGIVPVSHENRGIRGLVSYIPSTVIQEFLDSIENGEVEAVVGGHAARYIGSDQDPEKLNLEKVFRSISD